MNRFERLLRRLQLTEVRDDVFLGGAGEGGVGAPSRLFGGLVAAQATMAALKSTTHDVALHSLHTYFLRPGKPDSDIEYRVTRTKEGRNFHVRSVHAFQDDELILQLQASFQRPRKGVEHQDPTPLLGYPERNPEDYPNRDRLKGRDYWADMPIDVRMVTAMTANEALDPDQQVWLRVNGRMPEDPHVHLALIVYASDRSLLDTAWRPHANRGELTGASLDHIIWFHGEARFDDWLLYTIHSPAAHDSRGLAIGSLHDRKGRHIASVAQEGVLRFR